MMMQKKFFHKTIARLPLHMFSVFKAFTIKDKINPTENYITFMGFYLLIGYIFKENVRVFFRQEKETELQTFIETVTGKKIKD